MKKETKQLFKIKANTAFGEIWFVTDVWEPGDVKSALYNIIINSKAIGEPIKTTKAFIKGLNSQYGKYYIIPV